MTEHPWYAEVPPDNPLMQGDLIEPCAVLVFGQLPVLAELQDPEKLVDVLQKSAGIEKVRAIVMTQACDLEQRHVRNVILCPIYHLEEFRVEWEKTERGRGQNPTPGSWAKFIKRIRDGNVWNLSMLKKRDSPESGGLAIPHQVVDFHEVFSLPLEFLELWMRASGANRLRLLAPYREHLSQAFARFFMRVGLPEDIEL